MVNDISSTSVEYLENPKSGRFSKGYFFDEDACFEMYRFDLTLWVKVTCEKYVLSMMDMMCSIENVKVSKRCKKNKSLWV